MENKKSEEKNHRKKLEKLIEKRNDLKKEMEKVENEMFRLESCYFELTQGTPITNNLDFYIYNKTEKKKSANDSFKRIFGTEFPK